MAPKKIFVPTHLIESKIAKMFSSQDVLYDDHWNEDNSAEYLCAVNAFDLVNCPLPRIYYLENMNSVELKSISNSFNIILICNDPCFINIAIRQLILPLIKPMTEEESIRFRDNNFLVNDDASSMIIRLQDSLNIGYFVDSIVGDAYKNGFKLYKVRKSLNDSLTYIMDELENKGIMLPIDLHYFFANNALIVKYEFPFSEIDFDLKSAFSILSSETNFININFDQVKNKLCLSMIYFKKKNDQKIFCAGFDKNSKNFIGNQSSEVIIDRKDSEALMYQPEISSESVEEKDEVMVFNELHRAQFEKKVKEQFVKLKTYAKKLSTEMEELKKSKISLLTDEDYDQLKRENARIKLAFSRTLNKVSDYESKIVSLKKEQEKILEEKEDIIEILKAKVEGLRKESEATLPEVMAFEQVRSGGEENIEQLKKDLKETVLYNEELDRMRKAAELEVTKMEVKLRILQQQVEDMAKKSPKDNGRGGGASDLVIKQLEFANTTLQKTQTDLLERKKEVMRLKMDNSLLTTKLEAFEKKAKNNKKAS